METLTVEPEHVEEIHAYRTLSTGQSGMLIRRNIFSSARKHLKRYRIVWQSLDAGEVDTLNLFFRTVNGGDSFTWTPPGGSSGAYRAVEEDLTVGNTSSTAFQAEIVIEEV